MKWPTQVFETYEAWLAAGSPIGGVFPARPNPADDEIAIPERYRGVAMWYVALPNGQTICPWKRFYSRHRIPPGGTMDQGYYGEGWEISGEIPGKMTVNPSINASEGERNWHGWLTNGELVGPEMPPRASS